uniref:Uncharacterized protein n=1 Tax=Parascaris equorum TaxID=6256 RepID=A0A914S3W6_PAREQ
MTPTSDRQRRIASAITGGLRKRRSVAEEDAIPSNIDDAEEGAVDEGSLTNAKSSESESYSELFLERVRTKRVVVSLAIVKACSNNTRDAKK